MAKQIILQLDDADYQHVQQAIAKRQSFGIWPDPVSGDSCDPLADGSNIAGLAVAEICRGWLEILGDAPRRVKP